MGIFYAMALVLEAPYLKIKIFNDFPNKGVQDLCWDCIEHQPFILA